MANYITHKPPLLAPGALQVLHHPARASRVIQLFMAGAASHIDLWDYKAMLEKHHGEESDFGEHVEAFQDGLGPWMQSPFKFAPHGQTGKMISDVVQPLGECVDDIAFIHNMVGKTGDEIEVVSSQKHEDNRGFVKVLPNR